MQKLAAVDVTPFRANMKLPVIESGDCMLFCDALRFDVARRLEEGLTTVGLDVTMDWRLAALPTVTATAKPAISPVAAAMGGGQLDFAPVVKGTETAVNAERLRKLLQEAGYQVLAADDLGDPNGKAWTELGAIDQYGHQHGWKIAQHVRGELAALQERVQALLHHGWRQVIIVTDHGWLLLPEGLPKVELPLHLTRARKGRCAILKEGASSDQLVVPWHWDGQYASLWPPALAVMKRGKSMSMAASARRSVLCRCWRCLRPQGQWSGRDYGRYLARPALQRYPRRQPERPAGGYSHQGGRCQQFRNQYG
jgi:hypothetical protein